MPHPTDPLVADVVDLYASATRRLEAIVSAGLRRGLDPERLGTPGQRAGDATQAYRERQLEQALVISGTLERQAGQVSALAVGYAYRSGLVATDRTVGTDQRLRGEFGRVHVAAVDALAGNMTRSLEAAARRAGQNARLVFDRANVLDGALPASGRLAGLPFLGRRVNDPYRRLALETVAEGTIGLDTRRQVSAALARRLVTEGVTDAVTGFVDRRGRRWSLEHYARMVAVTTTREAMSAATVNRLGENGVGLVTISSHGHQADECSPYDGQTFALPGTAAAERGDYPVLDQRPPFHPLCAHVIGPAAEDFDGYLAELERTVGEVRQPAPRPVELADPPAATAGPPRPSSPAPDVSAAAQDAARGAVNPARTVPAEERSRLRLDPIDDTLEPPFSYDAQPRHYARTADRLEAQRILEADPGPELGAAEARLRDLAAQDRANIDPAVLERQQRRDRNQRRAALRELMDPDLAKELGLVRGTKPKAWAREEDVTERLLSGELTIDEAEQIAYEHYAGVEERRAIREETARANYGSRRAGFPCEICGKLKRFPADVCPHCGDDPVPLGYTAREHNAAFGYFGAETESRRGLHYGSAGFGKTEREGHWSG